MNRERGEAERATDAREVTGCAWRGRAHASVSTSARVEPWQGPTTAGLTTAVRARSRVRLPGASAGRNPVGGLGAEMMHMCGDKPEHEEVNPEADEEPRSDVDHEPDEQHSKSDYMPGSVNRSSSADYSTDEVTTLEIGSYAGSTTWQVRRMTAFLSQSSGDSCLHVENRFSPACQHSLCSRQINQWLRR